MLPDLAQQHDAVVVDGSASLSETTRVILARTDSALVPCKPTGLLSPFDRDRLRVEIKSPTGTRWLPR